MRVLDDCGVRAVPTAGAPATIALADMCIEIELRVRTQGRTEPIPRRRVNACGAVIIAVMRVECQQRVLAIELDD